MIQQLINIALTTLAYCLSFEILTRIVPKPKQVLKVEDRRKQSKEFAYYIAHFPALFFEVFIVVLGLYMAISRGGITYGQESTPFMQNILLVKK